MAACRFHNPEEEGSIPSPATPTLFKIVSVCRGGGYRYARTIPLHPKANANGLYPLHRVLMENRLGRLLNPREVVHHKDEDRTNDLVANLEVMTQSEHAAHHAKDLPMIKFNCPKCGELSTVEERFYRLRAKRNKNGVFCSKACAAKK